MTISIQVSIVEHRRTRNIHWRFFFLLPNQKECKILPCGALHCFFIHFFESVCFRFPLCYAQVLQDLRHFSYVWFFLCNVRSDGGCLYLCLLFDRDRCMISNPRGRVSWPCLIFFPFRLSKIYYIEDGETRFFSNLSPAEEMHVNTFTSHRWFAKDLDTGKSFLVNGEKQYIPRESHIDRRIHVAITVPSSWYFCRKKNYYVLSDPKLRLMIITMMRIMMLMIITILLLLLLMMMMMSSCFITFP